MSADQWLAVAVVVVFARPAWRAVRSAKDDWKSGGES